MFYLPVDNMTNARPNVTFHFTFLMFMNSSPAVFTQKPSKAVKNCGYEQQKVFRIFFHLSSVVETFPLKSVHIDIAKSYPPCAVLTTTARPSNICMNG